MNDFTYKRLLREVLAGLDALTEEMGRLRNELEERVRPLCTHSWQTIEMNDGTVTDRCFLCGLEYHYVSPSDREDDER